MTYRFENGTEYVDREESKRTEAIIFWLAFVFGICFALLCAPQRAHAQQAASPAEQALSGKLSQEIGAGLQCSAAMIAAQAKIKELEAQLAQAKPEENKKP